MWLRLENAAVPMKLVYTLAEALRVDPERVALAQALTLDKSRPLLGLKGTLGLFGSQQWWESIEQGRMPMFRVSGTIRSTYVAGQDETEDNAVELVLADGSVHLEGMYVNDPADKNLYRVGSRVDIVYGREELKRPARGGGVNYSTFPLELAVSLQPIP